MPTPDNNTRERWHVGKEIPLAFIAAIVVQTASAVWWARGQVAIDSDHERRLTSLEKEREVARVGERIAVIESAVAEIRRGNDETRTLLVQMLQQTGVKR